MVNITYIYTTKATSKPSFIQLFPPLPTQVHIKKKKNNFFLTLYQKTFLTKDF